MGNGMMFEAWFYDQVDCCKDGWDFGLRCNDATDVFLNYFYLHWTGNERAVQEGERILINK